MSEDKTLNSFKTRLDMLGEDFVFGSWNNALQLLASQNNAAVEWAGYIDLRTCNICDAQIGHVYRVGQFIPRLPAHPHCRCSWRLLPRESQQEKPFVPQISHLKVINGRTYFGYQGSEYYVDAEIHDDDDLWELIFILHLLKPKKVR